MTKSDSYHDLTQLQITQHVGPEFDPKEQKTKMDLLVSPVNIQVQSTVKV